jgi:hypothetical protein
MSRVKKTALCLSVFFSLGFLSLGLFTSRPLFWANQHIPAVHADAGVVQLASPAKTDGGVVLESYGEPTTRSAVFPIATENSGIFIRSLVVRPLFFRITLAPKVSRYISKSVLNL